MPWLIVGGLALLAGGAWVYFFPPNAQPLAATPGEVTVASSAGSAYSVGLPAGAAWMPSPLPGTPSVIGSGNVNVRMVGSSSVSIVYGGGGGSLTLSWADSTGASQYTILAFSG